MKLATLGVKIFLDKPFSIERLLKADPPHAGCALTRRTHKSPEAMVNIATKDIDLQNAKNEEAFTRTELIVIVILLHSSR